jgi:hypothetical protein
MFGLEPDRIWYFSGGLFMLRRIAFILWKCATSSYSMSRTSTSSAAMAGSSSALTAEM